MRFFLCLKIQHARTDVLATEPSLRAQLKIASQFIGGIEYIYFAGYSFERKKCLEGKPV